MKLYSPQHLSDVLTLLVEHKEGALLVAGGYHIHHLDSVGSLEGGGPKAISILIDLSAVRALRFHREESGWYILGSLMRLRQVMALDPIARHLPVLEKAVRAAGPVQMRNQTTLGGHLAVNRENDVLIAGLLILDAKIYYRTLKQDATLSILEFADSPRERLIPVDGLIHKVYLPFSDDWKAKSGDAVNFYRGIGIRGGLWKPERAVLYYGRREGSAFVDNRIVLIRKGNPMSLVRIEAIEQRGTKELAKNLYDRLVPVVEKMVKTSLPDDIRSRQSGSSAPIPCSCESSEGAEHDPGACSPEKAAVQMTGLILDGFIQELGVR